MIVLTPHTTHKSSIILAEIFFLVRVPKVKKLLLSLARGYSGGILVGLFTKYPGSKVLRTLENLFLQQLSWDDLKTREEAVCSFESLWVIMVVTSKCKSHKFRGKLVQEYLIVRRLKKRMHQGLDTGVGIRGCHLISGRRLGSHPSSILSLFLPLSFGWRGQRMGKLTSLAVILSL